MSGRLADKIAIVTGAGSRGPGLGNGKAAAILFAREGARVVCVDAKLENAEETAKQITQEGGEAVVFAADVTRKAECEAMVKAALDRWGAVDILHNNVGIESRKTLFEVTEEEWDQVMTVDLKSMLLATQAAAKSMVERGRGSIICVSSVAGMRGVGREHFHFLGFGPVQPVGQRAGRQRRFVQAFGRHARGRCTVRSARPSSCRRAFSITASAISTPRPAR